MIDPAYVRQMARYNAWQNRQLREIVEDMPDADLRRDHKAFFGSIFATLNHILWGDTMWMSRFGVVPAPSKGADQHLSFTETPGDWAAQRYRLDGRMRVWADNVRAVDLAGDLTWYSGLSKQELSKPLSLCIAHMFNHQTHHRGQVHAMLTAAGRDAPVTDLVFMPDDA